MTKPSTQVQGNELKVGDTIDVWWPPNSDTIVSLRPYEGPIAHIFKDGAQIAGFAVSNVGMTIENGAIYKLIARRA